MLIHQSRRIVASRLVDLSSSLALPQRALLSQNARTKKVVFSGIQPTGVPHLGNYLGALQGWVKQQDEADTNTTNIYSLVDLHAITVRQDPAQLRQWRKESLAVLLAVGLDPKRSIIFFQSQVPAHSELMWILSCTASVGYLSRMTQWKSKMSVSDGSNPFEKNTGLQLGLFSYPVLQAADVLVHRATHVPVGEDQSQHLEFARNCAAGFNAACGAKVLIEPETVLSSAKRIMSLTNPSKKMSKSDANEKSRINITDDTMTIERKIGKAVTDSEDSITFDLENRPGLSNLLQLLHYTSPSEDGSVEELARELDGSSKKAIKQRLTKAIDGILAPIRDRYGDIVRDEKYLIDVAEEGRKRAQSSAERTLADVKTAVGF